jgi:hypothetical protein
LLLLTLRVQDNPDAEAAQADDFDYLRQQASVVFDGVPKKGVRLGSELPPPSGQEKSLFRDFALQSLEEIGGQSDYYIVVARSQGHQIAQLKPKPGAGWS